jgi:hypothetical protein
MRTEPTPNTEISTRDLGATMEAVLPPPPPFNFTNNLENVTSGNLSNEWDKWKSSFMVYYEACELAKKAAKVIYCCM